jgi:uncharacterized protein YqeY
MTVVETIKANLKESMLARNAPKTEVLRGLQAAFMNEAIAKGKDALADEDALAVIRRAVKQRKDSIEQFTKGNRPELAQKEQAELVLLESYLPTMMSRDEIMKVAQAKKVEMNFTDKSKLGMFVGALMKDLKGKADGADVKSVAEELFK